LNFLITFLQTDDIAINRTDDSATNGTDDSATNDTDDSATNGTDNSDVDDMSDHGVVDVTESDNTSSSTINFDSDHDEEEEDLSSLLPPHYLRHITSAVYSYCGTEILASYSEDDIYLFDAHGRSSSVLHNYGGHINRMTGI